MYKPVEISATSTLDYSVPRWFAVYTKSRHEKKLKVLLDEKKIENYLPLKKEYHEWSDRRQLVEVPLIRGYIFVRIAAKDSIYVLEVPGAVQFIKFKNELAPIPDFQIEALCRMLDCGINFQPHEYLKTGQHVKICDGPMKDMIGIIHGCRNDRKLIITLDNPQMSFELEIDSKLLEPVKETCQKEKRVTLPLGI